MKRNRWTVIAGVLAAVASWLTGAPPTQAQAPSVPASAAASAATPRYFYGWGSNGWGYYYYPNVVTAPSVPRGGFYSAPSRTFAPAAPSNRTDHDYTSRHDRLSRPWLRPMR